MRICNTCGRQFSAGGAHKKCSTCRNRTSQCACGMPKKNDAVLCTMCVSRRGELNPNWRGGRTHHKRGYILVHAPTHPRATKSGHVFEHILVMEARLRRFLVPGETVHHKNGVRADNDPRNLELWTRPQPAGARVEDLVEWATELLALHAPERLFLRSA